MFDKFKEVDEKQEIEFLVNGYVLRISGRDQDDGWLTQSFIFKHQTDLFSAIIELANKR